MSAPCFHALALSQRGPPERLMKLEQREGETNTSFLYRIVAWCDQTEQLDAAVEPEP